MCRSPNYEPLLNDRQDLNPFTIEAFLDGDVRNDAIPTKPAKKVCCNKMMMRSKKKISELEDIPEEAEFLVDDVGAPQNMEEANMQLDLGVDLDVEAHQEIEEASMHLEKDLEVLRKAMDMGVWALCLGFGFVVSKSFHRARPTLFF
ncbi:hypothetical protein PIB30_025897 [Stylosanthes scabra]|uniref:t-SNARE coiled-coil homology domain-containing protein n=1 Tax=Stylosanthes scabra TaxID=79078 RepID=A0ABU6Y7E2_9FABA|nr:hypothetical protein [Stylosanthes scabra]